MELNSRSKKRQMSCGSNREACTLYHKAACQQLAGRPSVVARHGQPLAVRSAELWILFNGRMPGSRGGHHVHTPAGAAAGAAAAHRLLCSCLCGARPPDPPTCCARSSCFALRCMDQSGGTSLKSSAGCSSLWSSHMASMQCAAAAAATMARMPCCEPGAALMCAKPAAAPPSTCVEKETACLPIVHKQRVQLVRMVPVVVVCSRACTEGCA